MKIIIIFCLKAKWTLLQVIAELPKTELPFVVGMYKYYFGSWKCLYILSGYFLVHVEFCSKPLPEGLWGDCVKLDPLFSDPIQCYLSCHPYKHSLIAVPSFFPQAQQICLSRCKETTESPWYQSWWNLGLLAHTITETFSCQPVLWLLMWCVPPTAGIQWGYHVTKTIHNEGAQPISEIVHFENRIVC